LFNQTGFFCAILSFLCIDSLFFAKFTVTIIFKSKPEFGMKKNIYFVFLFILSFTAVKGQLPVPSLNSASQVGMTNSVSLSWTGSSSPTIQGYKLFYRTGSITKTLVLSNPATLSTTIGNLSYNNQYDFWMVSFNKNPLLADTTFSAMSTVRTLTIAQLAAPAISTDPSTWKISEISLRVVDANSSEDSFEIELTSSSGTIMRTIGSGLTFNVPINALAPKTFYNIRARAKAGSAVGPWSNTVSATTKMDVPPSVSVTSNKNCPTSIDLQWTASSRQEDIASYIIQRSFDNSSFNNLKEIFDPNTKSFTDNDAQPDKTHFYRVFTVNSSGQTPSPTISVVSKKYVGPNPVQNLVSDQSKKGRTQLVFNWTNGAEDTECGTNLRDEIIIKYKVNDSPDFKDYAVLDKYQKSVEIKNLNPKDAVIIAVIVKSNKGINSQTIFSNDTTAGPPKAPSNLTLFGNKDALNNSVAVLNWKDNSNDEDYIVIEKSTDNINFWQIGKIKFNNTTFHEIGIEEGVLFYYRVKAGSVSQGDSPYSASVSGVYDYSAIPNAPYGLVAKVIGTKVSLTWRDDSSKEENYIIEKSVDNGLNYTLVATLSRNKTSYMDENNIAGKEYIYRVKAVNPKGSSEYSNLEKVKISTSGSINGLKLTVYPNPTFDLLNIAFDSEISDQILTKVNFFDKNNHLVKTIETKVRNNNQVSVPVNDLPAGMYTVKIINGDAAISKKVYIY
jgi:Secretion system C-terminal sorting domain